MITKEYEIQLTIFEALPYKYTEPGDLFNTIARKLENNKNIATVFRSTVGACETLVWRERKELPQGGQYYVTNAAWVNPVLYYPFSATRPPRSVVCYLTTDLPWFNGTKEILKSIDITHVSREVYMAEMAQQFEKIGEELEKRRSSSSLDFEEEED